MEILADVLLQDVYKRQVQMSGGPETKTAQFLEDITNCIMKTVKIITYYAPVGVFGFFASLVATYGPELIRDYSRTLVIYYVTVSYTHLVLRRCGRSGASGCRRSGRR